MNYFTLITAAGQAKIAAAIRDGQAVGFTSMAVGDGGGAVVYPVEVRNALVNEKHRLNLADLRIHPDNPNWLIAEAIIPPDVGGWTIREVGVFDTAGDLMAYGNFPESYKPVLTEGSGKELIIRLQMQVSNAAAVTLAVDPSIVYATQSWVRDWLTKQRARRTFFAQS